MLVFSSSLKLMHAQRFVQGWTEQVRPSQESTLTSIGLLLELACAILYLVPRTTILGITVLLTGYLCGRSKLSRTSVSATRSRPPSSSACFSGLGSTCATSACTPSSSQHGGA